MEKKKGNAANQTRGMLPAIDTMNSTINSRLEQTAEKFISEVPALGKEKQEDSKKPFIKQKIAHQQNSLDVMYRVNLRDSNFMKIQHKLQTVDIHQTNFDPKGAFDYNSHLEL